MKSGDENPPRPLASGRVDPFAVYLYIIYTNISPPLPLPDAPARPSVPAPETVHPHQEHPIGAYSYEESPHLPPLEGFWLTRTAFWSTRTSFWSTRNPREEAKGVNPRNCMLR